MASAMHLCFKQRVVIEYLTAERCSLIQIQTRLKAVYDETCVDVSTVKTISQRCERKLPI